MVIAPSGCTPPAAGRPAGGGLGASATESSAAARRRSRASSSARLPGLSRDARSRLCGGGDGLSGAARNCRGSSLSGRRKRGGRGPRFRPGGEVESGGRRRSAIRRIEPRARRAGGAVPPVVEAGREACAGAAGELVGVQPRLPACDPDLAAL